jgi:geranylgeranyl pyrophosphate synthase
MTEGQIKEILLSNPSKQDYLEIVEKKTASLFETSAKIAALINFSYDKKLINYLSDYGRFFGIAFQITDDILDNSIIPFKDKDEAKVEVFFYIDKAQESLKFITNKNKSLLLDLTEELKKKLK